MKKRMIALSLCLCMAVAASVMALGTLFAWVFKIEEKPLGITSEVHKAYFEGDGTAESPYLIAYPVQLYYFAWLQDIGYFNDDGTHAAQGYMQAPVYFEVTNDLDMTGYTLPCIGTADMPFLGVFNGGCHVISNLTVTNKGADFYQQPANTSTIPGAQIVGFFGVIGEIDPDAVYDTQVPTAQNFALHNVTVKTDTPTDDVSMIGIVAGYVNGTVENVLVSACTVSVAESIGAMTTYTTNQSDYTLVGYAAKDQYVRNVGHLDEATPGYGPGTGGGDGQGDQFGGSINMLDLYNRVFDIKNNYATATTGEVPDDELKFSYTYENGAGSDYSETEAFSTYENVINRPYNHILSYSSTGDSTMGAASYSYGTNYIAYLYGAEISGINYTIHSTNETAFAIKSGSGNNANCLNINAAGNGITSSTSPSTYWRLSDQGHLFTTVTVGGKSVVRFLNAKYAGSNAATLFISAVPATLWTKSSNSSGTLSMSTGITNYKYIRYSSGWKVGSSATLYFSTTQSVPKITYQPIYDSQAPADTYLPLIADGEHQALRKNTGYIVAGSNYHQYGGSGNSYPDYSGDIRVARYDIANVSNSCNSTATGNIKVITRTAAYNGWVTIKDNNSMTAATDFSTLKTPDELGLTKYQYVDEENQGTKASITELLQNGGGQIYGLHFMNANIGMNNLMTARRVLINGQTYTDFQMPRDSIDFHLKEDGVINFYAGTYFTNNNCFFSLYQIERDPNDPTVITAINEIAAVYKKGDDIAYRFVGESNPPTGFTADDLAFDTSWLTNPGSNFKDNYIYYFEIPATVGEYALGSVEGKLGAYLIYLDISASGGGGNQGKVVAQFTNKYEVFQTPVGIQLATADEIAAYTDATVVDDTDSASYALTGFSGSVEIKKEIENGETVYKYYLNGSNTGTEITGTERYEVIRIGTVENADDTLYTMQVSGLQRDADSASAFDDVASFRYAGDEEAIADAINCVFIKDNTYEVRFNITSDITITDFTALNAYDVTAKSVGTGTLTQTTS